LPLCRGLFLPVRDRQYAMNAGVLRFSFCVPHFKFEGRLFCGSSSRCKQHARSNGGIP
jgi:hypothetical protein